MALVGDLRNYQSKKIGTHIYWIYWNKAVRTVAPVVFWKVGQFEIFRNFSITGSDNNTQSVWDRAVRGRPLQEVPGHTPEHDGQSRLGRWRRSVQHLLRSQVSWGSQAGESDEKGRDVFQVVHISRQRLPPLHGTGGHWRGFANNDFSRGDIYWNKNNHICSVTQDTQQVISEINSNARRVIHRYSVYTWRHAKPLQSN